MWYWLIVAFTAMLFRSYLWQIVAPETMGDEMFYRVYDLFGSVALLCVTKAAGYGRDLKSRVIIDFILAFLWADVIDRIIGVTTLNWRDCLIPLFFVFGLLASYKQRKNLFA